MDNYDVHNENDNNGGGGELALTFSVVGEFDDSNNTVEISNNKADNNNTIISTHTNTVTNTNKTNEKEFYIENEYNGYNSHEKQLLWAAEANGQTVKQYLQTTVDKVKNPILGYK